MSQCSIRKTISISVWMEGGRLKSDCILKVIAFVWNSVVML